MSELPHKRLAYVPAKDPPACLKSCDGPWKMFKRVNDATWKLLVHRYRAGCLDKTRQAGLCQVAHGFLGRTL